jgi:A/G-specific adenine glycosylase
MAKPSQPREPDISSLRQALLGWYAAHKRDLPWRRDRDAYRVWISEIMLQQTRVAAVLEHYRIFLEAFPTVAALAAAPEDYVLTLWSGLGYYRRARMLHRAAKFVIAELDGLIPRDTEGLRKLPGVGRYTAAAIASIAYNESAAVVDGNVERVLSRMDGQPRDDGSAWLRAGQLLDPAHPGDWNQAMMELGATVCTPLNPQCLVCPVRQWCLAPGAETRKPQAARKRVRMARALVEHRQRVYLVQRPSTAVKMAGMWELPELTVGREPHAEAERELYVVRHSITDTDYEVRVLQLPLGALTAAQRKAGRWVEREDVWKLPLTGLTRKILRRKPLG